MNYNEYKREYRKKNPHIQRAINMRNRFGITLEDWDKMYAEQEGKCGICGTDTCTTGRALAVDHCHTTGKVRGLLCHACNLGLGKFNDDPTLLDKAKEWLK